MGIYIGLYCIRVLNNNHTVMNLKTSSCTGFCRLLESCTRITSIAAKHLQPAHLYVLATTSLDSLCNVLFLVGPVAMTCSIR